MKKFSFLLVCVMLLQSFAWAADKEPDTCPVMPVKVVEVKKDKESIKKGDAFVMTVLFENLRDEVLTDATVTLKNMEPVCEGSIGVGMNAHIGLDPEKEGATDTAVIVMDGLCKGEAVFYLKARTDLSEEHYELPLMISYQDTQFEAKAVLKGNPKEDPKPEEPKPVDPQPEPPTPIIPDVPLNPGGDYQFPSTPTGGSIDIPSTSGSSVSVSDTGSSEHVKNKPKLIIDRYSFEPSIPIAGEEFSMNLSFYNTNADKSVRNIKIYLTSDETAVAANPAAPAAGGGSVFTPVNSSNTFYISYIEPGGTVQKSISLTTVPTTAAKNYTVVANFEYEDKDGNEYTAKELIGVPIAQKTRLQTGEIAVPQEAFVGSPIDTTIEFYNTGKDTLYNLIVKLEGDFQSEHKQQYVGNFQSGSSDSFNVSFTTMKPGENTGKILFTYEDSTGKEQTMEKPFVVRVSDQKPMDETVPLGPDGLPIGMEPENTSPLSNPVLIGGVLLAAAVAGGLIIRNRKKKKQQEDLTIDED